MDQATPRPDLTGLDPLFVVAPLKARLPADLLADLLRQVDAECADPARTVYGDQLAGRIESGEQIVEPKSLSLAFKAHLCALAHQYVSKLAGLNGHSPNPSMKVSFVDGWIVKSLAGDYNPVHVHAHQLSGIVYLRLPPQVADPASLDGKLDFVFGQHKASNLDFLGSRKIVPAVGDLYLFPAWLQHVVYPFRGAGERLSYSFNLSVANALADGT
jgi:uncharacterized protein (TIGR02466 family)